MNLSQAKITLEKINRLYHSMTLDSKIDQHEQQLMLSYIRQFHKAFSDDEMEEEQPVRTVRRKKTVPQEEPQDRSTPPKKVPVKASLPIENPQPEQYIAPTPPVVQPKVIRQTRVEPTYQPPLEAKPQAKPAVAISSDLQELFEQQEAKELSDRLSSMPIRDLVKSIGLNEKILTCNELFAKDNTSFNDALSKLNRYASFDEARPFLAELAHKYDWTEANKKKKAQVFIKLVRRRYK